ncbi:hypothetical protein HanHA89_Chr04g0157061 [Helianthus annuus]|nr:hypothetical protein HanHA89_Chr04g0157061 [Helianthus annuus]
MQFYDVFSCILIIGRLENNIGAILGDLVWLGTISNIRFVISICMNIELLVMMNHQAMCG